MMEEDVGLMALAKVQGMQSEVEAIEEQFASLVKSSEPKSVYQAAADMHPGRHPWRNPEAGSDPRRSPILFGIQ